MNFQPEKCLEHLKKRLQTTDEQILAELGLLEMRLVKNRQDGRLFGDDAPDNRSELNRILFDLELFSRKHLNTSFSNLCQDSLPSGASSSNEQQPSQRTVFSQPISSKTRPLYLGPKRCWAVLIGVGNYDDEKYSPLPICREDANKIANQLHRNESGFVFARIKVLTDDGIKPTRNAILDELQKVVEAVEEDDLFLFYFSGHGELEAEESYLVTQDGVFGNLQSTAIAIAHIEEIMQVSRAKAKVMILDACHAGEKLQSKGSSRGLHPKFMERVYMHAEGLVILASCEKNQESYVWEEKNCSAYTYFLMEALSGKADDNGKGFVTVDDINKHVLNGMAAWTERRNRIQTPTKKYIKSHGEIVVSYYARPSDMRSSLERAAPAIKSFEPDSSSILSPCPLSWRDSETILVRGETYILREATIREKPTKDGRAIWRSAQAQHAAQGNIVQLKQLSVSHLTTQGNDLLIILRKEQRLSARLAQHRGFPRLLNHEEITDNSNTSMMTLVYEGWTGYTLREVFQQSGRTLAEAEIKSLLGTFLSICEMLALLHRENCSHRALTADTIVLLDGDKRRPALQSYGRAAYPAKSGDKEKSKIQAPEQQHNTRELGLPGPLTDIYQLGAILLTLITGQPFSSNRHLISTSTVSSSLDTVIQRAVSTLPKDRWPTVTIFAAELRKIQAKER
jgi:serine/threonine protein kinase